MNAENVLEKLKNRVPSVMDQKKFKNYAVLLPLVKIENELHLLFEVRSLQMRSQPGDICFPGGRVDKEDANEMQCALRETSEELGIDRSMIQHVYPLDYLVTNNRGIIYPFAGEITSLEKINLNRDEVAEVFTVPLTHFLENEPKIHKINLKVIPEANFPFELIQDGKNYDWRTRQMDELFYLYHERVIWGLTAKIIAHFIDVIRSN
ncbi:CoA pyrophosphatase [Pseudogracilibacillus sp. SE30717A]|uniref:NUDIX hydrolase n=1 Tax=Pseudogracilibacillus sp. SE30717A TaxID=3098293 RepID=UPI00300DDED4